ncbi:MAG: hypothetical protein ABSG67_14460 [Thermoguttaceae bacterium]|jgi:hypothetical protein
MIPSAVLIQTPNVDFATFLGLCQQALGRNPAATVDASPLERSDAERFLACLAALRDRNASVGLAPNLLTHVSVSILAAADDRDMLDILQASTTMPFVATDTLMHGVQLAVITGTLAQWRDAVKSGCSKNNTPNMRVFFNRVMSLFESAGLGGIWKDFESRPLRDQTFYLEDKRQR